MITPRLTIKQAAELTHRHPETIRQACQSGELVAFQRVKGGHWRIRLDHLENWLDGAPTNLTPLANKKTA